MLFHAHCAQIPLTYFSYFLYVKKNNIKNETRLKITKKKKFPNILTPYRINKKDYLEVYC